MGFSIQERIIQGVAWVLYLTIPVSSIPGIVDFIDHWQELIGSLAGSIIGIAAAASAVLLQQWKHEEYEQYKEHRTSAAQTIVFLHKIATLSTLCGTTANRLVDEHNRARLHPDHDARQLWVLQMIVQAPRFELSPTQFIADALPGLATELNAVDLAVKQTYAQLWHLTLARGYDPNELVRIAVIFDAHAEALYHLYVRVGDWIGENAPAHRDQIRAMDPIQSLRNEMDIGFASHTGNRLR